MATSSFRSKFSSNSSDIATLQKKAEELKGGKTFAKDERFWSLTRDKSGVGYARIRFLSATEGEEIPWVRLFTHVFKGPRGQFYWENCPTSLTPPGACPCCESNSKLWATEDKAQQAIARGRKRKLSYISNILVIEDPACPENEGKVFLFSYGKGIFDKINEKMNPTFKGDEAINPFDFWTGCDLRLKAKIQDDFVTYDPSEWASPKAISEKDEQIEAVWKLQYKLLPLVAEDQFKPYSVLQERLNAVLLTEKPETASADSYKPSENISRPAPATPAEQPPFETTEERSAAVNTLIQNPKTAPLPGKAGGTNLAKLKALAAAAEG